MFMRQDDFRNAPTMPRHARLFELMRQGNAFAGQNRIASAASSDEMEAFRNMACASLKR
ncbi:hypothetical protein [Cognatishimia activa]|uniref:hypothetical protein n=1 Tax=Cognatishimia activa TaxID=1715691 RepID=UPI0022300E13|nr:hypothetical protein [Cognatishimia activa]UZD92038.1 hypothetical protein M0D42_05330 [Cognatishimia activa]